MSMCDYMYVYVYGRRGRVLGCNTPLLKKEKTPLKILTLYGSPRRAEFLLRTTSSLSLSDLRRKRGSLLNDPPFPSHPKPYSYLKYYLPTASNFFKPLPPGPASRLDVSSRVDLRSHFCYRSNFAFSLQLADLYAGRGFPDGWGIRRGAHRPLSPMRGCPVVLAMMLQDDGTWVLLEDGVYTA